MIGVILHYYGSPTSIDGAADYYSHIIHRQPEPDKLAAFLAHYRKLGRPSPLGSAVERIQIMLERRLNQPGDPQVLVRRAGKHAPPFAAVVTQQLIERGATKLVSFPLTPFYSRLGAANYHRAVKQAAESDAISVVPIDSWYLDPDFIQAGAIRLRQAIDWLPQVIRDRAQVIFTIHSTPRAEVTKGPSIPEQYDAWAKATAQAVGVADWQLSYRSAPGGDDRWLGPDVLDVIRSAASDGRKAVVICPLPTLFDNIEVLQEAGSDAQAVAHNLGLHFVRTDLFNDSADMVDFLERLIREQLSS